MQLWKENKLIKNQIIRNIALIIVFSAVGFVLFTENVRPGQIIGLFACGAVAGASFTNLIVALKTKQKAQ